MTEREHEKIGKPAGTLVHLGEKYQAQSNISFIDYTDTLYKKETITNVGDLAKLKESGTITWVQIEGLQQTAVFEELEKSFGISSLVLEDILNTKHRPKCEAYGDMLFLTLKRYVSRKRNSRKDKYEQISIVAIPGIVITFKEFGDSFFETLDKRIMNQKSRIRNSGADFLVYSIADHIVDQNFLMLNVLEQDIESTEGRILAGDDTVSMADIQFIKKNISKARKSINPLAEILNTLMRNDENHFNKGTLTYIRDINDHVKYQVSEIDSYMTMAMGLSEIHMSVMSNRMNEIMKMLTAFAAIFIPLTFMAGVYGMNFEYMPELKWKWAYHAVWALFLVFGFSTFLYFRRRKWI